MHVIKVLLSSSTLWEQHLSSFLLFLQPFMSDCAMFCTWDGHFFWLTQPCIGFDTRVGPSMHPDSGCFLPFLVPFGLWLVSTCIRFSQYDPRCLSCPSSNEQARTPARGPTTDWAIYAKWTQMLPSSSQTTTPIQVGTGLYNIRQTSCAEDGSVGEKLKWLKSTTSNIAWLVTEPLKLPIMQ